MANSNNFWAGPNRNGTGWQVKRQGDKYALSLHATQEEAWAAAKARAKAAKGEAFLQNRQGEIRERNSYGNDPSSSKG